MLTPGGVSTCHASCGAAAPDALLDVLDDASLDALPARPPAARHAAGRDPFSVDQRHVTSTS
jgi:hypothetical protein